MTNQKFFKLSFHIIGCSSLWDRDDFSDNDPYCIIKNTITNEVILRTKEAVDTRNPSWEKGVEGNKSSTTLSHLFSTPEEFGDYNNSYCVEVYDLGISDSTFVGRCSMEAVFQEVRKALFEEKGGGEKEGGLVTLTLTGPRRTGDESADDAPVGSTGQVNVEWSVAAVVVEETQEEKHEEVKEKEVETVEVAPPCSEKGETPEPTTASSPVAADDAPQEEEQKPPPSSPPSSSTSPTKEALAKAHEIADLSPKLLTNNNTSTKKMAMVKKRQLSIKGVTCAINAMPCRNSPVFLELTPFENVSRDDPFHPRNTTQRSSSFVIDANKMLLDDGVAVFDLPLRTTAGMGKTCFVLLCTADGPWAGCDVPCENTETDPLVNLPPVVSGSAPLHTQQQARVGELAYVITCKEEEAEAKVVVEGVEEKDQESPLPTVNATPAEAAPVVSATDLIAQLKADAQKSRTQKQPQSRSTTPPNKGILGGAVAPKQELDVEEERAKQQRRQREEEAAAAAAPPPMPIVTRRRVLRLVFWDFTTLHEVFPIIEILGHQFCNVSGLRRAREAPVVLTMMLEDGIAETPTYEVKFTTPEGVEHAVTLQVDDGLEAMDSGAGATSTFADNQRRMTALAARRHRLRLLSNPSSGGPDEDKEGKEKGLSKQKQQKHTNTNNNATEFIGPEQPNAKRLCEMQKIESKFLYTLVVDSVLPNTLELRNVTIENTQGLWGDKTLRAFLSSHTIRENDRGRGSGGVAVCATCPDEDDDIGSTDPDTERKSVAILEDIDPGFTSLYFTAPDEDDVPIHERITLDTMALHLTWPRAQSGLIRTRWRLFLPTNNNNSVRHVDVDLSFEFSWRLPLELYQHNSFLRRPKPQTLLHPSLASPDPRINNTFGLEILTVSNLTPEQSESAQLGFHAMNANISTEFNVLDREGTCAAFVFAPYPIHTGGGGGGGGVDFLMALIAQDDEVGAVEMRFDSLHAPLEQLYIGGHTVTVKQHLFISDNVCRQERKHAREFDVQQRLEHEDPGGSMGGVSPVNIEHVIKGPVACDGMRPAQGCAAVRIDDRVVYIHGGVNSYGLFEPKSFLFDTKTFAWSQCVEPTEVSFLRESHTIVKHGDAVYLFGGTGPAGMRPGVYKTARLGLVPVRVKEINSHSLNSSYSSSGGDNNDPRAQHRMLRTQQPCPAGYHCTIVKFDLRKRVWSKPETSGNPSFRARHCAVVHAQKMYVWGGWGLMTETAENNNNNNNKSGATTTSTRLNQLLDISEIRLNTMEVYDYQNCVWETVNQKGHVPTPRVGHSGVLYNDALYVFGGSSLSKHLSKTERDAAAPNSTELTVLEDDEDDEDAREYATRDIGGAVVHDSIVIHNDLHLFDFNTRTWQPLPVRGRLRPQPREGHNCALFGSNMFIFGGIGVNTRIEGSLKNYAETVDVRRTPVQPLKSCFVYSLNTHFWREVDFHCHVPDLPVRGVMFAICGQQSNNNNNNDDVENGSHKDADDVAAHDPEEDPVAETATNVSTARSSVSRHHRSAAVRAVRAASASTRSLRLPARGLPELQLFIVGGSNVNTTTTTTEPSSSGRDTARSLR
eukprot:PhM_4_TR13006/c1_g1_i1/m.40758